MSEHKKRDRLERLKENLDIEQMRSSLPEIVLKGNREAVLTRCDGVQDYDETTISLVVADTSVTFYGSRMELFSLASGEAVVKGEFRSIEFS